MTCIKNPTVASFCMYSTKRDVPPFSIMSMEIVIPEENVGDVIGDLNARRGRVLGVDSRGGYQVVKAQAPMAEVLKYAQSLTSITSGKGSFTMDFDHYDEAPPPVRDKIVAAAKSPEASAE